MLSRSGVAAATPRALRFFVLNDADLALWFQLGVLHVSNVVHTALPQLALQLVFGYQFPVHILPKKATVEYQRHHSGFRKTREPAVAIRHPIDEVVPPSDGPDQNESFAH